MMQKKHESDLTRKEKWQLEREKVASMSWKKRIEYFFTYYKWVLVVAVAVIVLGVFGVNWYKNLQKEELLNVVIVNSSAPSTENLNQDLRKALKIKDKNQIITIDTSVYTGEGNQTTYNSTMKLSVVMGARTADIFVCDKETFATYDQDGVFLSVEELMGSEFCEAHAEEVGENYILANQSKLAEEYGIVGYEDAYIGVFSYTEHREHAKAFVEFLFE